MLVLSQSRLAETRRSSINHRHLAFSLLLLAGVANSGCAALGLALLGAGAGTAAGSGISYTLDSIAYKTFAASEEGLRAATLKTLKRMDITVTETERTEAGSKIVAEASDRTIEVELDRLTTRTSRMRVNAKQGWFLRDRATAMEIILQTERTIENEPRLARLVSPPAAAPAPVAASRSRKMVPLSEQTGRRDSSAP